MMSQFVMFLTATVLSADSYNRSQR